MSGTRRRLTGEESSEYRADAGRRRRLAPDESAQLHATPGEPGSPGHDLYADGPNAHVDTSPTTPKGEPLDAVKSFADNAALGAGPQIAGVIGAIANSATQGFSDRPTSDLDAYRAVRDDTEKDLAAAERTTYGQAVAPIAALATPIPVKGLGRGASVLDKAKQGLKVGGAVGALGALANAPEDFTKADAGDWGHIIARALAHGGVGALGGGMSGGLLGKTEPKLSATAENQALKAAGLRGGITNQVQRKLGLSTEEEARALGRQFLDEDLIPFGGSKEQVAKRAEALQGQAGNAVGSVLDRAEMSGSKFDYDALAGAARKPIDTASSVASDLSGQKAYSLADALEAQGAKTPGSFKGANAAKSDAWKSARFDDEAPMAAQLYRKAVGAARDDIQRQVGDAIGPEAAADLANANQKYGVAADALKLARNAGTRDQANSTLGLREQLMLAAGLGGGAGASLGHGLEGLALGAGGALLSNIGRKRGNAAAARFADFLAERAAQNSGGVVGAAGAEKLAEYLGLLPAPAEAQPAPDWADFIKEKKR